MVETATATAPPKNPGLKSRQSPTAHPPSAPVHFHGPARPDSSASESGDEHNLSDPERVADPADDRDSPKHIDRDENNNDLYE